MRPQQTSVAVIVIIALLTVTTVLLAIYGAINHHTLRSQRSDNLHKEHSILADQLSVALALPVWNFDREQIDRIIEGALKDDDVSAVIVQLADRKSSVHGRSRDEKWKIQPIGKEFHDDSSWLETREISANKEALGQLKVFVTPRFMEQDIRKSLIFLIGGIFGVEAILVLSLFLLLQRLILRPLDQIESYADKVSSGREEAPSLLHGKLFRGELESLRSSISTMVLLLTTQNHELRESETQLRHLKNFLANIIDSMPAVLISIDTENKVTEWNRHAELLTGLPSGKAVGQLPESVLPDFAVPIRALREQTSHGATTASEKHLRIRDGEREFYDLMLYPLVADGAHGAVLRIENVTERTQLQEMMIQTEKMMSLGGLAAGMAHEINNPLGIITQAAQNIERRLSPQLPANQRTAAEMDLPLDLVQAYFERREIPRFIMDIREAASRAAKIVANMLQFSRKSGTERHPALLTELLDLAVELAANDYDLRKQYDFRSIEIVRDYQPNLPLVPIVTIEIQQVFLNILKNAAQAMADNHSSNPKIILRAKAEENYALIQIADNGPGMEEKVARRIFEPFFTTKPPGAGTGLGLSVSYMIISRNHQGFIRVDSIPGNGCQFTIKLPLSLT